MKWKLAVKANWARDRSNASMGPYLVPRTTRSSKSLASRLVCHVRHVAQFRTSGDCAEALFETREVLAPGKKDVQNQHVEGEHRDRPNGPREDCENRKHRAHTGSKNPEPEPQLVAHKNQDPC